MYKITLFGAVGVVHFLYQKTRNVW